MNEQLKNNVGTPIRDSGRLPSINDVAKLAGVSSKTVSNVLHSRSVVRPGTRERVLNAVQALGYHPNMVSRQLRYGKSNTIMLAVPELRNTYFSTLAHEVMTYARKLGYAVLIMETAGELQREEEVLSGLNSCTVDGIILSTIELTGSQALAKLTGLPVVLLGEKAGYSPLTHVGIDNRQSGQDIADLLISRGCRDLVFLGADQQTKTGTGWLRMQGCLEAVKEYDQDISFRAVPLQYSFEEGARAVLELAQQDIQYDGLICGNDALALGAMWELRRHGLQVPQDVCVAGWDGSAEGKYANPSLTTVAIDIVKVAQTSVDTVIAAAETGKTGSEEKLISYRLIERESTRR